MTTQPISHETDARQGRRHVISSRRAHAGANDATNASQTFQLFNAGAIRVNKRNVTIAPASIAGLVLACVSITACNHADSRPVDRDAQASHETTPSPAPLEGLKAASPAAPKATTAPRATAAKPLRTLRAGALTAMRTPALASADMDDVAQASSAANVPAFASSSALVESDVDLAEASSAALAAAPPGRHGAPAAKDIPAGTSAGPSAAAVARANASWVAWGAPAAATVALSAGLLAFSQRRRKRRKAAETAHTATPIGWKGWSYRALAPSRAEFFGAERPELPLAWAIDRVQLDGWTDGNPPGMKPATDARYGLMKPARPPKIDLSLDDDAFIHWASDAQASPAAEAPRDASLDLVRLAPVDVLRRNTEAASQAQDYDNSSSPSSGVAMAHALVSAQSPALQPMQEPVAAEDLAKAEREHALRVEAARREAEEREQQQREAERLAHLRALELEAARIEAERVEAERRQAMEREAQRVQAEQRAAAEARAQREDASRQEAVAEAKKLLTAGYPSKALDALAPALATPHATGEAWTVAGWCWWRTARDNGPDAEKAVMQAIEAFHRAIAAEPDREAMLGSALIRCHLFMAEHLRGDARAESLDAALRMMGNVSATRRNSDAKFVLEHANALYERAQLSAPEACAQQLEQAQQLLSGLPTKDIDADARWLMVTIALAQAQQTQGRAADAALARAAEALADMPADAPQDTRDQWLARLIDVELLRIRPLKSAARLMRLRQLRDIYAPKLAEAHSILPLLSWIQVLREWAGSLSERPAREKLAEAEAMFERIVSLSPDDIGSVHFARAYYLRLRSAHESISAALDTLEKADALLAKAQSPVLSRETISLERAEVALARAPLMDRGERQATLEQAVRYADVATSVDDGNLPRALSCAITARLARFETITPSAGESRELADLAKRLLQAAPYDAQAMRLSARGEFAAGHAKAASELCEAAWDAGCRDVDLLRLWRESLHRLPDSLADAANDPQWKRLNQCTRLAQSIGLATQ